MRKNHCNAVHSPSLGSEENFTANLFFTASANYFAMRHFTCSFSFFFLQLIQEPEVIVENGLSVYNPLLVGAVSYVLIPQIYGSFDAFSLLLVLLATILRYIQVFYMEYLVNILI